MRSPASGAIEEDCAPFECASAPCKECPPAGMFELFFALASRRSAKGFDIFHGFHRFLLIKTEEPFSWRDTLAWNHVLSRYCHNQDEVFGARTNDSFLL